jgi:hypothetical protein
MCRVMAGCIATPTDIQDAADLDKPAKKNPK